LVLKPNKAMKHLSLNFILIVFSVSLLVIPSCKKENQYSESASKPESPKSIHKTPGTNAITSEGNEGMMEFAEPTPNPYTLENMQQALDQLTAEANAGEISFDGNIFNIRVTHKYIVFKPTNDEDYETLIDDTTLILFDYPLDRKIIKGGTYYRDPEVQEGQPNYQWTCVPIEKQIDIGVHYEVLAELYLPEEDPNLVEYYEKEEDDYITVLIDKAMQLTGNYDTAYNYDAMTNDGTMEKWWKLPSKWTPKGRITMSDDVLGTVNMRGVKVRAHRWFELRECLTDWNSYFNILHQFRYPVNYSIKWERNDFNIKHKSLLQAYFNGPHHRGDWYLNINSGYSRLYGTAHRAAFRYYFNNRLGLRPPPVNGRAFTRVSIGVFEQPPNGNDNGDCAMIKQYLPLSEIRIFGKGRSCMEIYATTIHELAHASHWSMNIPAYWIVEDKVAESWACGVQWALTRLDYPNYQGRNSGPTPGNYTNVVLDMIDNPTIEANTPNHGKTIYLEEDQVENYTILQIENALNGEIKWNGWRDNIKNTYDNETETYLDALYLAW
jgi:hypothetical protein